MCVGELRENVLLQEVGVFDVGVDLLVEVGVRIHWARQQGYICDLTV